MKRWYPYLIGVPLGLVILAYLIVRLNSLLHFAEMWSKDNQAKDTQRETENTPAAKALSKDLLELRQKHHLRPLTEREDGTKVQDVPDGIYGFSMCGVVSLSAKRGNKFSLEIHKHDGIVYYVGYASDEHIKKYLTRQNNFHLLVSPHSWEGASVLFEIPVEFVAKCEERRFRDGYLFDLFVADIPILQS
ncbi:MAG: hypothetical protein ACM34B_00295 [Nitrospira sp.]